jgi:hypothetical protein
LKVLHLENLGRDLPGEWFSADLCTRMTEETKANLQKEYKRKLDEDTLRVKKMRQEKK